tara:strand:+ start:2698 stop:3066 length:369 start_codon:yes stop_codon:yes gene_type:complete
MENKTIFRDSLNVSREAEEYAIKLDTMYSLLVSTPHFEDTETEIEDWAINYFHKETKEEIEWTIASCLLIYINETGNKVSHVVTNPTLKNFCLVKESSILGKEVMVTNNLDSVLGLEIEVKE